MTLKEEKMAITRDQLDELDIIIRDLRMAKDIKEQIDAGEERGLISFADGEKISIAVPQAQIDALNSKITELEALLITKSGELT